MSEYRAIYKCRLCGEEFEDGRGGDEIAYLSVCGLTIKENFNMKGSAIGVHRYNIHNCKDGSYGMADFCGFRKVGD